MKTLNLFFLAFLTLAISACLRSEENMLEGKWIYLGTKNQKIKPGGNSVIYEFYADNHYTYEENTKVSGNDGLLIRKGEYELQKEDEQLFLTLKEQQIEGYTHKKYIIKNLTDSAMVWQNERNTEYFLTRADKFWYDK